MEHDSTALGMWPQTNKMAQMGCDENVNHVASSSEPCDKMWVKENKPKVLISCKSRVWREWKLL